MCVGLSIESEPLFNCGSAYFDYQLPNTAAFLGFSFLFLVFQTEF